MDPIQPAFKRFIDGNFEARYEALKKETLENFRVQSFLAEHPELKEHLTENRINELYQYQYQLGNCDNCPGLEGCPNLMQGFQPKPSVVRGDLELSYQPCHLKRKADERKRQESFIKSLHIPKEMLDVRFEHFEQDSKARMDAFNAALTFAETVNPGTSSEGLYIYGPFGVGKTFLIGAIANYLADEEISTMVLYTPDFVRELKNGISDGTYQEKLERVMDAPVLILDDFGAETMSSWVRDEVIGALLQHRMMEKLPTIFTSNLSIDELEVHLSSTHQKGVEKVDALKAQRILERIRYQNQIVAMKGENKRLKR